MTRRRASTEGAAAQSIAEAATEPTDGREQAPIAQTPPASLQSDSLLLPSEHVDYTALLENELHNRIHGLQSGIAALEGVLSGKQSKHNATVAEMTGAFETEKADLLRRIDNLKTALRMAKSGVAAKDQP